MLVPINVTLNPDVVLTAVKNNIARVSNVDPALSMSFSTNTKDENMDNVKLPLERKLEAVRL
jgi:hypothetical protein